MSGAGSLGDENYIEPMMEHPAENMQQQTIRSIDIPVKTVYVSHLPKSVCTRFTKISIGPLQCTQILKHVCIIVFLDFAR